MTTPDDTPRPPLSGEEAVKLTARYMFAAWVDQHAVRTVMEGLDPKTRDAFLEAGAEHRAEHEGLPLDIARAVERTYALGYERGMGRERAHIILALLERRFGPLDEATAERIRSADAQTHRRWLDHLLAAPTLDDVFTD